MKKIIILIACLLMSIYTFCTTITKTITLNYCANDFEIEFEDSLVYFSSDIYDIFFSSDTLDAALPHIIVNVLIQPYQSYNSFSYSYTTTLVSQNILIQANAEEILDTMQIDTTSFHNSILYSGVYPSPNVKYVGEEMIDGAKILVFDVCPFIYNANTSQLYLLSQLDLDIELEETSNRGTRDGLILNNMFSAIENMIVNTEELLDSTSSYVKPFGGSSPEHVDTNGYEYIIVTTNAMKTQFQRLADWKTQKGVKAKVITLEDINTQYSQYSRPELRIKNALKNYYNGLYNKLRYVVLGGGDAQIPSLSCYVRFKTEKTYTPTDWFYACFDTMDWDYNQNGKYGEIDDYVDLYPEIFVTRLPAKNASYAKNMVDKIIEYESNPSLSSWTNQILMGGAKLHSQRHNTSDAEYRGDKIFRHYIQPNWNGTKIKFYDTATSFTGGAQYQFNVTNLQNVLSQEYPLVYIYTHGLNDRWKMEEGSAFQVNHINGLTNNPRTIITTNSCYTNEFDNPVTCLGVYFMQQANSGVIGYWGSSRTNWSCWLYKRLSSGNEFVGEFYKQLFSSEEKHFGNATTLAKVQHLGRCKHPTIYSTRWALFTFNALGDPELAVYTQTPSIFSNVSASIHDNQIDVSTGLQGCKICLMSKTDNGEQYYSVVRNASSYSFDLGDNLVRDYIITITKPGYIPYTRELNRIITKYIQNQNIVANTTVVGDEIFIGSDVTTTQPYGNVSVSGCNLSIQAGNKVIIKNNFILNNGATLQINNQ